MTTPTGTALLMRKEQRLRHRTDFAAAYREGRAHGNNLLVVRLRPNGTDTTRFGFVAGKAVGGAVVRNRVKRRLRAIADRLESKPGLDIVAGARRDAAEASFQQLERALVTLLRRADALAAPAMPAPDGAQH